jgi:hypothetical protein
MDTPSHSIVHYAAPERAALYEGHARSISYTVCAGVFARSSLTILGVPRGEDGLRNANAPASGPNKYDEDKQHTAITSAIKHTSNKQTISLRTLR